MPGVGRNQGAENQRGFQVESIAFQVIKERLESAINPVGVARRHLGPEHIALIHPCAALVQALKDFNSVLQVFGLKERNDLAPANIAHLVQRHQNSDFAGFRVVGVDALDVLPNPAVIGIEDVAHGDVIAILPDGPFRRLKLPFVKQGVDVDVIPGHGVVPVAVVAPPVGFAAKQQAHRGGALLPVNYPDLRRTGVRSPARRRGVIRRRPPEQHRPDGIVLEQGYHHLLHLGRRPDKAALEFGHPEPVADRPVHDFPDAVLLYRHVKLPRAGQPRTPARRGCR